MCAAGEGGDSLGRRQQGERSEMDFLWPPNSICLETPPHKKPRLTYSSDTFDGRSVEIKGAALQPLGGRQALQKVQILKVFIQTF